MKENILFLENVKLGGFHNLYTPQVFDGVEGKYGATFLLEKSRTEEKNKIDEIINRQMASKGIKEISKHFLQDGDEHRFEGYKGYWVIKATNKVKPKLIDGKKRDVTESEGLFQAGAIVNIKINPFAYDGKKYGKLAICNLFSVQLVTPGGLTAEMHNIDEYPTIDDDDNGYSYRSAESEEKEEAPF